MPPARKLTVRNIKLRPTLYGIGAIGISTKLAIEKSGELRQWQQLQQEKVIASGNITSDHILMSSSGKVIGHELSYEFLAPGTGGSQHSSAEVQAQLQEQFLKGESAFTIDSEQLSTPATGEQFHRGKQLVKAPDYNNLKTTAPVEIIYAASDPSISAIAHTNASPSLVPMGLTLLFFSAGLWFLWQGLKTAFQPSTPSTVNNLHRQTIKSLPHRHE